MEDHRRKWNVDEYERLTRERTQNKEKGRAEKTPVKLGHYCSVCECNVKYSMSFLDHINGRKHQKNLGMSMKLERSTLDQVKKRFETNKRKREEEKKQYCFEERVKKLKEDEEIWKDGDMSSMMGFSGL
ncbi:hypothetical protein HELRODRAFT_157626 [Helobdella robusta]|uniref:U1-type domain-containing protein n=1 Tax=Helobdella robusta TaxID=6412 RepID=T1EME1_HELRO|nr:hypothetical protein HELRODRAFT_157626 [Helobdella robusta]ESN95768.1 hypothetical protein HELRODRAFT_157626 [Helobdella robusta]